MLINREKKHLHIHVPKTGGTSLLNTLKNLGWNRNDEDPIVKLGLHGTLCSLVRSGREIIREEVNDYYTTTMIRNPWDHAVSLYKHKLRKSDFFKENTFKHENFHNLSENEKINLDTSFERFVKKSYSQMCQSVYLKEYKDFGLFFDEIFNFSEYNKMLETFENKFDILVNEKYTMNEAKKSEYAKEIDFEKPYKYYYNEETYEIVKNLSIDQIKIFNYTF